MNKMVDQAILPNQAIHMFKASIIVHWISSEDLWFMITGSLKLSNSQMILINMEIYEASSRISKALVW